MARTIHVSFTLETSVEKYNEGFSQKKLFSLHCPLYQKVSISSGQRVGKKRGSSPSTLSVSSLLLSLHTVIVTSCYLNIDSRVSAPSERGREGDVRMFRMLNLYLFTVLYLECKQSAIISTHGHCYILHIIFSDIHFHLNFFNQQEGHELSFVRGFRQATLQQSPGGKQMTDMYDHRRQFN